MTSLFAKIARFFYANFTMKSDPILSTLSNFLVPIILIYGLFSFADFFVGGFFAFIYSMILFVSAFMTFYFARVGDENINFVSIELIAITLKILLICYLITILSLITNIFSL